MTALKVDKLLDDKRGLLRAPYCASLEFFMSVNAVAGQGEDKSCDTDIDLVIATLLNDAADLRRKHGPDCHLGATFEAAARFWERRARDRSTNRKG